MMSRIFQETQHLMFLWNEKQNNDKAKLYFKGFLQTSSEINLGDNRTTHTISYNFLGLKNGMAMKISFLKQSKRLKNIFAT